MTSAQISKRMAELASAPANTSSGAKNGASTGAKTAPRRARAASSGRKRAKIGPAAGWGERIRADLTKKGDPPAIAMLITQAARCADRLEALDRVLRGDAANWLRLEAAALVDRDGKVPARVTVELKIDDALREERQQSKLLSTLFSDIHRQRASLPPAPPNGTNGGRRSILEGLDDDE